MKSLLPVILFMFMSGSLYAQSASIWKHFLRPDVGSGITFYSLADSDTAAENDLDSRRTVFHVGSSVGLNFPFVEIADDFTAGLSPNLGLTFGVGSFFSAVTIDAPIYATLKYKTDATWAGSKSVVGASAGIGYQHTGYFLFDSGTFIDFGLPVFMAEVNFGKKRSTLGLIKVRYTASIGSHTEIFPADNGGEEGQMVFKHWGLHLLFTPAY